MGCMKRPWAGIAIGVVMIVVGAILYAQEVQILGLSALSLIIGGVVAVGWVVLELWLRRTNRFR